MAWYYILLIVLAVAIAVYVLVCALFAPKILKGVTNPRYRSYDETRKFQEDKEHWDFTKYDVVWDKIPLEITTFDGLKLFGQYVVNNIEPQNRKKVAIICHGHATNIMQSVKYADIFYNRGYSVVMYDQRSFGNSEGYFSSLGIYESKDLEVVVAKVKEIFGDDALIALHGESMGGATVLNCLKYCENEIAFVVADCPFGDAEALFRETVHIKAHLPSFPAFEFSNFLAKGKYGIDFKHFSPKMVVRKTDVPICFIHGTADRLILPKHSTHMYDLCKNENSELHLFEGGLHARCHMLDRQKYIKIVGQFIEKNEKLLNV